MKAKFVLLAFIPLLIGCGSQPTPPPKTSNLKGVFKNAEVSDKHFKKTFEDSNEYLYGTNYPQFNLSENTLIRYATDQKLSLKKDFTYRYEYSIALLNSNADMVMKLSVDISGTFTYEVIDQILETYYVQLSNPTSGTETINSCTVTNTAIFDYWSYHESPDMTLDIAALLKSPDYSLDQFVQARKVKVSKALSELDTNKVEDALYYRFILDDFCKYSIVKPVR